MFCLTIKIKQKRIKNMNNTKETYLVTCALPYVNNEPHLGNVAGNILPGDAYSKWLKKCGNKVLFLCGTDEYGTATEIKAQKEGLSCEEICNKYREKHIEVYNWFNINFDIFGRTTTETQTEMTHGIFEKLWDNQLIVSDVCLQLYCEKCDRYVCDRFVNGKCYHENCDGITTGDQCDKCCKLIESEKLTDKWCSICKSNLRGVMSKHLYFTIDKFREELKEYFLNNGIKYISQSAYNITKQWLNNELENRSVTRDLKWGTPMPNREDMQEYKDKVFYVWFDAPIGYLSILKHGRPSDWQEWLTPNGNWIQFMAKDNVPFHSIIFPATLLGSNFEMRCGVTHLAASEYLLFNDTKFSKSNNIGIFGNQVIEISKKLNIDADYWRYYLLKIRPESTDSNFTYEDFLLAINGELVSKFGNLVQRVIKLKEQIYKSLNILEYNFFIDENNKSRLKELIRTFEEYMEFFKNFNFHGVIRSINKIAEYGNLWLQRDQPWVNTKANPEEEKWRLSNILVLVYILGEMLIPIMPTKGNKIISYINTNFESNKTYEEIYEILINGNGNIEVRTENYCQLFRNVTTQDFL